MFSINKCTKNIWVLFAGIALSIFLCDAVCQAEMMYACVNKYSRLMRMVDAPNRCFRRLEKLVSWNNVPQEDLDAQAEALAAAQATITELTEQLTSLESEKVDPVVTRVNTLEDEDIPAVSERVTVVEDEVSTTGDTLSATAADVDSIKATIVTLEDANDGVVTKLTEADARVLVLEEALDLDDTENSVIAKVDVLEQTLEEDVTPIIQALDADSAAALSQLATYMRVENTAASKDTSTTETLIATEASTPVIIFEGVNVHIRSGLGATDDGGSGLGNLIIGYDELPGETQEEKDAAETARKAASHNLVIGPEHTYSSIGGLVAGFENTVSGKYVTVSGGTLNTADGTATTVSGGTEYTADDVNSLMPLAEFVELFH